MPQRPVKEGEETVRLTVRLPTGLLERAEELAEFYNTSVSSIVRQGLETWCKRRGRKR